MQSSASSLQIDPSSSTSHHSKMKYLASLQAELLREEARIRENLIEIQNMVLPIMGTMQKHIAHCNTLVQDQNFSVADHMIQLSAEGQVALSTAKFCKRLGIMLLPPSSRYIKIFYLTLVLPYRNCIQSFGIIVKKGERYLYTIAKRGRDIYIVNRE